MSITVTPPLGDTKTLQVGTPFSYSFAYSDVVTATDSPVYSWTGITSGTPNSTVFTSIVVENFQYETGFGMQYPMSNMAVNDIFSATLPRLLRIGDAFTSSLPNYLSFGHGISDLLTLSFTGEQVEAVDTYFHYVTIGSYGPFLYYDDASYARFRITSVVSPYTVEVKIVRPTITSGTCTCYIVNNVMYVTDIALPYQVSPGMVFPAQGDLTNGFTVNIFLTGHGGPGTYGIAPLSAGPPIDFASEGYPSYLECPSVANSGDIIVNEVVTDGFFKFLITMNTTTSVSAEVGDPVYNITVNALDRYTRTYPAITLGTQSTSDWTQFTNGAGTGTMTISAPNGIQYIPTTNPLTLYVKAGAGSNVVGTFSSTVTIDPIVIDVTPTLGNPLTIKNYIPFFYSFSIPDTVIGVTLSSNETFPVLSPYIAVDGSTFSSDIGFTTAFSNATFRLTPVIGNSIVGPIVESSITSSKTSITVTPALPSGSVALYVYEPFSYVFTTDPDSLGLTLQFSRSSSQIVSYCALSADGTSLTYSGTYLNTSSGSVLNLFVDLMYGGSIVMTTTILVSVGKGRFYSPDANKVFLMFQNENITTTFGTNPAFLTILPIDSIVSTPSLPSGLTFGSNDSNSWYLQGKPVLQSSQSNYVVYGSNSTSGRIVSVPISIKVGAQQVSIDPATISETGLVVGTPITSVPIVATEPIAISRLAFQFTWDSLPSGFEFQDMSGATIPWGYSGGNQIQLVGTPTLAAASSFASNGITSNLVRLTGTQVQGGGVKVTGSSVITFAFAETVLFSSVTIPALYATENLGYKNVFFEAATYFAYGSAITSIVASSLPPGLSLSSVTNVSGKYRVYLLGTPTVVDQTGTSYSFTATNANSKSITQSFVIPILPDIVSFTDAPAENTAYSYIVSKQIEPITFSASSSANKAITSWTLSLSPSAYGLSLSGTSGSSVTLLGTPTNPLAQTSVTITATDSLGSTVTRTLKITIANDTFTWPTYAPTFIQNKPIDDYRFQLTTASGRQIQSFSATGLPAGILLSPGGVLSGTPTGSTGSSFTISATTGYVSPPTGSQLFTYTIIPDNILTVLNVSPTPVPFTGTSFTVANLCSSFSYSGFSADAALVAGSVLPLQVNPATFTFANNVLSGTVPPYQAPQYTFQINATRGTLSTPITALLTLSNSPAPHRFLFGASTPAYTYDTYAYTGYGFSTQANTASQYISSYFTWLAVANTNPTSTLYGTTLGPYVQDVEAVTVLRWIQSPTHPETVIKPGKPPVVVQVDNYTNFSSVGQLLGVAGDSAVGRCVALGTFSNASSYIQATAFSTTLTGTTWVDRFQDSPSALFTILYGNSPQLQYISGTYYLMINATTLNAALGYSSIYTFAHPTGSISPVSTTLPTYFVPRGTIFNTSTSEAFMVGSMSAYSTGGSSGITPPTVLSNFYRGSGTSWTQVANPLSATSTTDYTSGIFDIKQASWGSMSTVVICGSSSTGVPKICYSTNGLTTWTTITPAGSAIYKKICFDSNSWSFVGGGKIVYYDITFANPSTQAPSALSDPLIGYTFRPTASAGPLSGSLTFPISPGPLVFTKPTSVLPVLYQYCPLPPVIFQVTGGANPYTYYYSIGSNIPVGMTFTTETTGTTASLTGIPANYSANPVSIVVYAANGTNATFTTVSFRILAPSFVNPQVGAGAYTALLRADVEGNAAQNARDNRVFPQVDPLAGPLMAPRAPDVITMSNCFLGLCKKPCPTCHTMI